MSTSAVWQMSEDEISDVCWQIGEAPAALIREHCARYLRNKWGREPEASEVGALVKRVLGGCAPASVQG